jgi:hypothetical protein
MSTRRGVLVCFALSLPLALGPRADAAPRTAKAITTRKAVAKTIAKPSSTRCHPSYIGDCLPLNGPDVDCRGGSGNGPLYTGRIQVVGPDPYDLDRDGDGIGCETS